VGIIAGALLHRWRALRDTLDPLFATYYAVPVFAFYPFFIVVFGLGDLPQILIAFMLGVVAMIVNTLNGLDRVPVVLLKTARIMQLSPIDTALRMTLPSAGTVSADRRQTCRRLRVHRRHRFRVHCARRHRLRNKLCLCQLRQRDNVPAHPADPVGVGRDQRHAFALGATAADAARACDEQCALPGLSQFAGAGRGAHRDLAGPVLVGGRRRARPPARHIALHAKLFATESFEGHLFDTMRAFTIAFALSVVIGLLVGFWLGFDRLWRRRSSR
jgi:hypothetical protein